MSRTTKTKVTVRLRCSYDNGHQTFMPGEVIDLPKAEALFMIKAGLAENAPMPAPAVRASGGDDGDSGDGDENATPEGDEGESGK